MFDRGSCSLERCSAGCWAQSGRAWPDSTSAPLAHPCTHLGQLLPIEGGAMCRVTSLFAIALAVASPWRLPPTGSRWQASARRPCRRCRRAARARPRWPMRCACRSAGALQVQPTANTTVEVSCPDAGGWRLFVPVKVRRNQTVLVLNRGIGTGETLTAADITTAQRDAARIAGAVLSDPNARSAASPAVRCRPEPCCRTTIWWCSVSSSEETMWPWCRVAARSRSALPAVRWVMPVRTNGSRSRTCPRGGSCKARSMPQVT